MTPEQFVAKWKASKLRERQESQEQFIDLCRLLDEKTPAEADATGESYCFERPGYGISIMWRILRSGNDGGSVRFSWIPSFRN